MKNLIIVACILLFGANSNAQNELKSVKERRAEQKHLGIRSGEELEFCGSHWKMQEMFEKHPAMKSLYTLRQQALEREYQEFLKNKPANSLAKSGTIYTIPVVFHVLHQNGVENITYDQVVDAIAILNRDYRLNNTDASAVNANFSSMPADSEIEFALATIAPNGNCFNGITRTDSYYTYQGNNGGNQVQAIIDGNDVYNNSWPGDEYLNIFVASDIGGAAGYTTNPGFSTGMANGIWIQHSYVGSLGTGSPSRSRALTHEVGHWLNLSHCWGPSNNPGLSSNCGDDDGVNDTPECIGVTACLLTSNSCSGDNGYWGFNQIDNVENYMEYSYCSKMYTQGQVDRMRIALTSSTGGRNNIWQSSNLIAVGADAPPTDLCKADFFADEFEVCSGDVIQFTDASYNNVTGWSWTFTGGTPSSSTTQNPSITYGAPGVYPVTLEVTDGSAFETTTKTAYISVLPTTGRNVPFSEGFESIASVPNLDWYVDSQDGAQWQIKNGVGSSGSKSIWINNSSPNSGTDDSFISSTMNLENASAVNLSFKYAFARRNTTNTDKLEVWASPDCGVSWVLRKNISPAVIGTAPEQGGNFVPSSSQWAEVNVTNINSTYWTPNFRFMITYAGGGGNNIYVDDINLDATIGVAELETVKYVNIYPNPAEDQANIEIYLLKSDKINMQVLDMVGKVVDVYDYAKKPSGKQICTIDTGRLSKGVYMVRIQVGSAVLSRRLVVD